MPRPRFITPKAGRAEAVGLLDTRPVHLPPNAPSLLTLVDQCFDPVRSSVSLVAPGGLLVFRFRRVSQGGLSRASRGVFLPGARAVIPHWVVPAPKVARRWEVPHRLGAPPPRGVAGFAGGPDTEKALASVGRGKP